MTGITEGVFAPFIFRHRIGLVPLEALLESAEKSSFSRLREQGPK